MSGDVDDHGDLGRRGGSPRQVEIPCDVQSGRAFEDDVLDTMPIAFHRPGDARIERRARGQWMEAQHVEQLFVNFRAPPFPVLQAVYPLELIPRDGRSSSGQMIAEQLVALRGGVWSAGGSQRLAKQGSGGGKK